MFYSFAIEFNASRDDYIVVWFIEMRLAAVINSFGESDEQKPSFDDFEKEYRSLRDASLEASRLSCLERQKLLGLESTLLQLAYQFLCNANNARTVSLVKRTFMNALSANQEFRNYILEQYRIEMFQKTPRNML